MDARALLKTGLPIIAHRSGLARALSQRYGGAGTLFMLHSVVPDGTFHPDASLRCPVSRLDAALGFLRRLGVDFVSLDEAVRRLQSGAPGRFAAFTFDDGFADNLVHALPVMERHGAPFTVYVTTGMMTGEIDAWWLGLAELIRRRDTITLPSIGRSFTCESRAAKVATYIEIERLVHDDYMLLPLIRSLIALSDIDIASLVLKEGLTRDQIRRFADHPLVTIGAHGTTHINLALAPEDAARSEMAENRSFLELMLDRPVRHFAYPFGNPRACGIREAKLAKELGFETAVTTRHGAVFSDHLRHLHALPRETLASTDTPSTLSCKVGGFYRAVRTKFGPPVAHMLSGREPSASR
ncbi:polysaccharide deacetylase family protein [Methylobacterium planeticum]|uniref:Chitooligosaccharide deacetylase n=1 Tax=Methylobacterium planeticum TaxID=2615211 RepID=A0A6N6MSY9_9HYPH|nr:polysaccharide deacetylase family protein [Methylobacterium planeticum]KAB1074048.1 polysaccharide deacetylase family protein [Methylobacterium planeticum]